MKWARLAARTWAFSMGVWIVGGVPVDQVKAARVTADYDTRYGRATGPWTTDRFVEAVYNSLKQPRKC